MYPQRIELAGVEVLLTRNSDGQITVSVDTEGYAVPERGEGYPVLQILLNGAGLYDVEPEPSPRFHTGASI